MIRVHEKSEATLLSTLDHYHVHPLFRIFKDALTSNFGSDFKTNILSYYLYSHSIFVNVRLSLKLFWT